MEVAGQLGSIINCYLRIVKNAVSGRALAKLT